jgi:hypothetical protein
MIPEALHKPTGFETLLFVFFAFGSQAFASIIWLGL